jgi:hypothetical protein
MIPVGLTQNFRYQLLNIAHPSWDERRRQAFAVSQGYHRIFERTGDTAIERIAQACLTCGSDLRFRELVCEAVSALKGANFCRARLCPLCNWGRSLKLSAW